MDAIFLFAAGITTLSVLLAIMVYLLSVSRWIHLPDTDEA